MTINLGPIRRIAKEITMGDTIKWSRPRPASDGIWDDESGIYMKATSYHIYSGLASIYSAKGVELTETRGGQEVYLVRYWVAIPVDAGVVGKAEDEILVTAVNNVNGDPTLVGQIFVVKSVEFGTLTATKRASTYRLSERTMRSTTLDFSVTGDKTLEVIVGHVKKFIKKSDAEIDRSVDDVARDMQKEVRSRAQGRPGPRRITGAYYNSIQIFKQPYGFFGRGYQKSVGSFHPAAHRLENGFTAVDSLGRHYNQPPFAHWRPSMVVVHQRWQRRFNDALPRWWG